MGSLLDFGKKIGLLEDTPPPAPAPTAEKVQAPAPAAPVQPRIPGYTDPQQKQKYLGILNEALQKADLPGPDFLEFLNGLRGLAASAIPEEVKFSTALTMFGAQGVTPQKLVETAAHYIDALEREEDDFTAYISKLRETKVVQVQAKAEEAAKSAQAKQEQIQKLNEEILGLQSQSMELRQSAAMADAEIAGTIASFTDAKGAVAAEINSVTTRLTAIANLK